jgi:hypothetical protein
MIQSRTALLRLFVSSALAFEAPFWICQSVIKGQEVRVTGSAYQIRDVNNLFFATVHETVLKARNQLEESLEDTMFSSLSVSEVCSQDEEISN